MVGTAVSVPTVTWRVPSASALFVTSFNMEHKPPIVAYRCPLLHAVFALATMI